MINIHTVLCNQAVSQKSILILSHKIIVMFLLKSYANCNVVKRFNIDPFSP
jgi:hypothetical protein